MNWLIYSFLLVTHLLDRLKCPCCIATGTYKLHPPCVGGKGNKRPWRWLCKFCGYYRGPEGEGFLCYPSATNKAWSFISEAAQLGDTTTVTPAEMIRKGYAYDVNPWRR